MTIHIISEKKFTSRDIEFHRLEIEPPLPLPSNDRCVFGYDPGTTKMGVTWLWHGKLLVYEVSIIRSPDPVVRIINTHHILDVCVKMFDFAPILIIEGSSFGNNFRQVELAEVRASAVLWALHYNITPKIIPPTTIRKVVFGNGKTKAEEVWSELPPNAASSLACAYYQIRKEDEK